MNQAIAIYFFSVSAVLYLYAAPFMRTLPRARTLLVSAHVRRKDTMDVNGRTDKGIQRHCGKNTGEPDYIIEAATKGEYE